MQIQHAHHSKSPLPGPLLASLLGYGPREPSVCPTNSSLAQHDFVWVPDSSLAECFGWPWQWSPGPIFHETMNSNARPDDLLGSRGQFWQKIAEQSAKKIPPDCLQAPTPPFKSSGLGGPPPHLPRERGRRPFPSIRSALRGEAKVIRGADPNSTRSSWGTNVSSFRYPLMASAIVATATMLMLRLPWPPREAAAKHEDTLSHKGYGRRTSGRNQTATKPKPSTPTKNMVSWTPRVSPEM